LLEDGFVAANTRFGEVASTYKHGALGFNMRVCVELRYFIFTGTLSPNTRS